VKSDPGIEIDCDLEVSATPKQAFIELEAAPRVFPHC
jgi:hypothetical protein